VGDVLILCYHALSPAWEDPLAVPPDEFERQLTHLLRRRWHPMTFTAAVLAPASGRALAITFDDAFASVFKHAAPVLEHYGAPATVFVPSGFISSGTLSWPGISHWEHSPHAPELHAMSWDDLGQLADRGWEIGSHTVSHPHLTELDDERLSAELDGSREDLTGRLGTRPTSIAYPYGDVDPRVAAQAADSGYQAGAALSSRLARLGPLRSPRVGIYRVDRSWRFRLKVAHGMRGLRASRVWPR
jgi:peptidoglycan/xylan/chitin deacetylase (PgdA/CDA1 family)